MRWIVLVTASAALAACSARAPESSPADVAEPAGTQKAAGAEPVKVSVPQMAYAYSYAFRLPADAVATAQTEHVALCDQLGPTRCQLLAMDASTDGGDTSASLKLRVASGIARAFGARLTQSVAKAGGRALSSKVEAEDVSKAITDTEARLTQRTLLVERLTEVLRTRKGSVAELVEAERGVAAAQEEIDQARAWLTELRGRVAMSTLDIRYDALAGGGTSGPLGEVVSESWAAFAYGLALLLRVAIFLLPWALLVGVGIFAGRRLLPLLRRRRAPPAD